jgi:hypothetical protein
MSNPSIWKDPPAIPAHATCVRVADARQKLRVVYTALRALTTEDIIDAELVMQDLASMVHEVSESLQAISTELLGGAR